MKLAIIVDSSSGLSKKETEAKGWIFLPLYMNIEGKEYIDGVDISIEEFYKMIKPEMKVRTSATPPGLIIEAFDKAMKEYDAAIVYSLSAGLSSQNKNIKMIAKDYKNIAVIDSQSMGKGTEINCNDIEAFSKTSDSLDDILAYANKLAKESGGVLIPRTMDWLVAGGRVSPAAAKMAGMLKIIPVIGFIDGNLIKYGKGRNFEKTIYKSAVSYGEDKTNNQWVLLHSGYVGIEKIRDQLLIELNIKELEISYIPPVIGIHTGTESICVMSISKK